jgi:recombinational DNA repair protein RecR
MTDEKQQKISQIQEVLQAHLRSIGCATCQGNKEKKYCQYCTPIGHNNMWRLSSEYSRVIAEDILEYLD